MIWRPTLNDLLEYRESPALNQSYLSEVVSKGKSMGYGKSAQDIGDLVDLYLTVPDLISEIFTVYTGITPSVKVMEFLTDAMVYLAERKKLTANIEDHRKVILKQAEFAEFDQKKTEDVRFKSIVEKAGDWWRFSVEAIGKKVVIEKDRSFANEAANAAKKHPATSAYFPDYPIPGRDLYYQKPIFFELEMEECEEDSQAITERKTVKCKALPDLVILSAPKETIYIKEIKTIYDSTHKLILEQIKKYDYVDQCSFYREAVRAEYAELIEQGYEINVELLFISKNLNAFKPVFVPVTDEMMDWSRDGGFVTSSEYRFKDDHGLQTVRTVHGWKHWAKVYQQVMDSTGSSFNPDFVPCYISEAESVANYFD